MPRSFWLWARPLGGAAILAFLVWRLGSGPFLQGLHMINVWALASALAIGALTTWCCAWRWSLVARGLGVTLPVRTALAHCYRSTLLNATLPGGVLGDVHRAVNHGRDAGDIGRGIRAVVWERSAGQVVMAAMAMVVLFVFPSPVRPYMPVAAAIAAVVGLGALVLARVQPRGGISRWAQALRTSRSDIRHGLLARHIWPGVVLSSAVVVSGYLAMFLIAARTAGATAPLSRLVPLTLLALLAMGLPLNVGGWGPREGVAAWAFGAAGLTVTQGITTAVVYGALALVSCLPGAWVLIAPQLSRVLRRYLAAGPGAVAGGWASLRRGPLRQAPVNVTVPARSGTV
jgi:hypothetical protein